MTIATLDAAAKGRLAERMVPVAIALVGVVRDQDADGVGEFMEALSDEERAALPVILAAMIPDDKTPQELLAWVDFDEHGAPLPKDVQMVLFSPRQYRRTAPVQPCGTPAAVRRHYDHGERLCGACRPVKAAMSAAGRRAARGKAAA